MILVSLRKPGHNYTSKTKINFTKKIKKKPEPETMRACVRPSLHKSCTYLPRSWSSLRDEKRYLWTLGLIQSTFVPTFPKKFHNLELNSEGITFSMNEEDFRPFLRLNFWLFFSEKMTPMAGTLRWTLNGGNTATGSWPIGTRARASPISGLILSISLGLAPPSKDNPRRNVFRLTEKKNPDFGWESLETKILLLNFYSYQKKNFFANF